MLRDLILSAADLPREAVVVPEWTDPATGGALTVHVRTLSGADRSRWTAIAFDADGRAIDEGVRSRLLVFCVVDADGTPVFTPDDVAALEGKNSAVLSRLFKVARRLNGIGQDEEEKAEKN